MVDVVIHKLNEVHLKIVAEPHVDYELRDHFTFEVPNAKFMPQYRGRNWNGEIHLYDLRSKRLYVGLLDRLVSFCVSRDYKFKFEANKFYGSPFEINEGVSREGVKDYITSITNLKARDYQVEGVYDALRHNRRLLISPTASGKSLMIYAIVRYFVSKNQKILLVVPTTSLVEQMYKDFADYGWVPDSYCHRIYSGKEKTNEFPVTITTWQSIYKLDRPFFEDYDVVIGDEAHLFKSKSLISIMTKLDNAKYRFGFTGTLDGTQTHKWVLEGVFGPSYKVTRTAELMEKGHVAQLDIQCIVLKHSPQKFEVFEDEVQYLINHEQRNNFIKNLVLDLKGNTLVLFQRVEAHGKPLFELIQSSSFTERKIFFVHGGVDTEEREEVRKIVDCEQNAVIVASYGVFSTGINIRNLHNVVFASPSKSRIRNLQSIGRVLRKGNNKTKARLYDISDDCSYRSKKNYTLNHLIERIKIYNEEKFNYDIVTVNLK
tara:strand:+ start:173 stop:1633 length:1461 start_codon:yes stop_codon:yes gene_type:complete